MKVPIRGACRGSGQPSGLIDLAGRGARGPAPPATQPGTPGETVPPAGAEGPGCPQGSPWPGTAQALHRQAPGEGAVSLPRPSPAPASSCPRHCSRPPRAPGCPAAGWCSWPARSAGTRPWGWCPSPPAESRAPSCEDSPSGPQPAPGPRDFTRCHPIARPARHGCSSWGTLAWGSSMSWCPGRGLGCCGTAAQLGPLPKDPPCPAARTPYLKEGHVLAIILFALLQVRAVDEGTALLGIAIACRDTAGSARQPLPQPALGEHPPHGAATARGRGCTPAPMGGLPGPWAPCSRPIPGQAMAGPASQPPASPPTPRMGRSRPFPGAMCCPARPGRRVDPPERIHAVR